MLAKLTILYLMSLVPTNSPNNPLDEDPTSLFSMTVSVYSSSLKSNSSGHDHKCICTFHPLLDWSHRINSEFIVLTWVQVYSSSLDESVCRIIECGTTSMNLTRKCFFQSRHWERNIRELSQTFSVQDRWPWRTKL